MSEKKYWYYQLGNACITNRSYDYKFVKFPDGVRRISGREYRALMNILKEKEGDQSGK